jgi:adenine/guanine phosphoribosyltransferase-like PRPP-binding protein
MPIVERLGAALAAKVARLGAITVIAPAMGGLVIGQEVARQLRVRFIFAEKEEKIPRQSRHRCEAARASPMIRRGAMTHHAACRRQRTGVNPAGRTIQFPPR